MVRTKINFKPFVSPSASGSSANTDLVDGAIPLNSYSDKVTFDILNKMDELEHPTAFQVENMPESLDIEK